MNDCIFCKIVNKEIPASLVFENDFVLAFSDINPQAPHHYLIIPKRHVSMISEMETGDQQLIGMLFSAAKEIAKKFNFSAEGFRTIINNGHIAGQTVFHIHLHLLGGRVFTWPPG